MLGRNVIAVINSQDLNPVLRPGTANNPSAIGQRLHFIIASDPTGEGPRCLAADGVKGNVPRLGLENVSTTGCQSEGIWFCGTN